MSNKEELQKHIQLLNEIKVRYPILNDTIKYLEEYQQTLFNLTLDECIKIWKDNGWTIIDKEQTELYLRKPNYTCYTYPTIYYISFYIRNGIQFSTNYPIDEELLNLLHKTLYALKEIPYE